jgi:PAS domain S-box-containing protein
MEHELGSHRDESLSVDILVIDDNTAWAQLICDQLEQSDATFSMTTATGATEAQSVLSNTSVDCIVCDYYMPKMNGIEFLEHTQQEFDSYPFILVTGKGSEEVASKAISQGVSDYITKDEVRKRPSALVNRINNAVENHRLQERLRNQRKQYQSIAQQTIEAICITENRKIVFANDKFTDIVGIQKHELIGDQISDVLEMDTEWVTPTPQGSEVQTQQIIRQTEHSSERIYEVKHKQTDINGTKSVFWSFRDITAVENNREQLRYERDLSQIMIDILAQSPTADTLESLFCERISNYEQFSFAWVGEPVQGSKLSVQAHAGDGSDYLSQIESAISDTDNSTSAPPSLWTFRKQESQILDDISALPDTRWQQAAMAQGFRSAAMFPLVSDDLCHGVFCVYSTETAAVDANLNHLLSQLSRALAGALADKKNAAALSSNEAIEIGFKVTGTNFYLNDVLRDTRFNGSRVSISVESIVQRSEQRCVEFLQINNVSADLIADQLRKHEFVDTVSLTSAQATDLVQVETDRLTLAGRIEQLGISVSDITVEDGIAEVTIQSPVERDQHTVLNQLREEYTVEAIVSYTTKPLQAQETIQPSLNLIDINLTEKQKQSVETAYRANYFTQPRDNSAREVADMLEISHTTFLQHLRAAQQKIFQNMFDSE